jgi:mannose-1-phosphate guanylyltransferase/mannose-6-phosphate isomerase
MTKLNPFTVERPWGSFRQFTHNGESTVKLHWVKPGEKTSLQTHEKRDEFWRVVSGSGKVQVGEEEFDAAPGKEYFAPAGVKHRLCAGAEGMMLIEIATGDFDEEDITRYEDKYGRA